MLVAENVPVPLLDHAVPALLDAVAPVTTLTAPEFEQVVIAVPADAVAAAFTVTVKIFEAAAPVQSALQPTRAKRL